MTLTSRQRFVAAAAVGAIVAGACASSDGDEPSATVADTTVADTTVADTTVADTTVPDTTVPDTTGSSSAGNFLGSYTLADPDFGTMTTVTVDGETRLIETNALPDHATGDFPNPGNPNAISAQDVTYEFPVVPTFTGAAIEARTPGVAVNGVKFEPATAETVTCGSGETYRVEALQDVYDLGFDMNNAHVQPTGEYHYHGISQLLADAYATGDDLVHLGFAADGHLIYYSKQGAYSPSYVLDSAARTGSDCVGSTALGSAVVDVAGSAPDGTYTSDWVFDATTGDLDECNGVVIDGEYAYVITDEWPFIGRCLNGAFTESGPGGPPPGGGGAGGAGGGPPPGG